MHGRFSDNGECWRDGQQWRATVSEEGRWRWDGAKWQPTDDVRASGAIVGESQGEDPDPSNKRGELPEAPIQPQMEALGTAWVLAVDSLEANRAGRLRREQNGRFSQQLVVFTGFAIGGLAVAGFGLSTSSWLFAIIGAVLVAGAGIYLWELVADIVSGEVTMTHGILGKSSHQNTYQFAVGGRKYSVKRRDFDRVPTGVLVRAYGSRRTHVLVNIEPDSEHLRLTPLPQLSPDGLWWWGGSQWQPATSPDGVWRWDGASWVSTNVLIRFAVSGAVLGAVSGGIALIAFVGSGMGLQRGDARVGIVGGAVGIVVALAGAVLVHIGKGRWLHVMPLAGLVFSALITALSAVLYFTG